MKTLRLVATLFLALTIAGCSFGRSTSPTATTAPPASATSAPELTEAPPTAAPAEEATEEPTAEPAEKPTEEPAEEATEGPTEEPVEEATPEATGEAEDEPAEEAAADEPLYLSIIWHQHQPVYYKDPETGVYAKPWVRLHATKDYVDMADLVDRYPNVHVTFNLTPSLLRQVLDLEAGAKDAYWVATERPAEELTAEEKRFILRRFFDINPKIVDDFPRYVELQEMRGSAGTDEELDALAAEWSAQDFRDLQLLFNLGWTDPDWRAQPPLDALVEKGRDFTEEDKAIVLARHAELIADVIPVHAALLVNGKIEVTMTPYAHPILPLLVSTDLAREAMPDARLPAPPFQFGQDAQAQLQRGVELYTEIFGFAPSGMWPGEGSVAEEIVTMVSRAGITWMASDEEVLAKSLGLNQFQRDSAETVQEADDLYRPYYVQGGGGGPVAMVFRDRTISDKVGFTYSGMDGSQAAADFLQRIENIRQQLAGQPGPHLVTVILDGENAWEHYENDGKEFLNALYQGLAESETIETVTPSEYLELYPEQREIENLWAGSWINADYSTWIGEDEENKAWALLLEARQRLQRYIGGRDEAEPEALERAIDLMYIAEGSDWFWWYGSDQDSGDDGAFDAQFRDTLIEMYEVLGAEVPDELRVPLIAATAQEPAVGAQGLITVTVDGVAAQGEWELAGRYDVVGGVAQRADDVVGSIYYGFDARTVYVRLDARTSWADLGPDGSVGVYIGTARATDTAPFSRFGGGGQTVLGFDAGYLAEVRLSDGALAGEATLTAAERGEWAAEPLLTIPAALQGQTIEMAIPLEAFGEFEAGDMIDVRVVASRAGADIQALPATGIARLFVPDLGLTTALLTVADPEGDDYGPGSYTYPTDAVFQPGAFDITEFVVAEDENNLVFRLTVAGGIENVWTSPRGISVQTFDVYIDTGQGAARKLLPGRNAAVAEGGWDYAVWLEGWEGGLYQAQAEGNPEEVQGAEIRTVVDGPAGRVTIKIPKSALPEGDPREWRYLAGVLGQEGFPSTGVWRVRDVAPRAQQWRFGGALPGTNGTRFIDLALPADSPVSQEQALTPPVESDESNPDNFAPEDLAQVPMVEVTAGE